MIAFKHCFKMYQQIFFWSINTNGNSLTFKKDTFVR